MNTHVPFNISQPSDPVDSSPNGSVGAASNGHHKSAQVVGAAHPSKNTAPTGGSLNTGVVGGGNVGGGSGGSSGGSNGPSPSAGGGQAGSAGPHNDRGLVDTLAETISSEAPFARDPGDRLYRYHQGVYVDNASRVIKERVKQLLRTWDRSKQWSTRLTDQVEAYIAADAPSLLERPPESVVNLANGLLDLATLTLHPHTPQHRTTVQLPVHYDPQARCPTWERILSEMLPADVDTAGIIWQLLALLMTPNTNAEQVVLFLGEGGNGKSVLLNAVRAFLGSANVSSKNLDALATRRFEVADLRDKLANIAEDLPSTPIKDGSLFKMIASGNSISAERKYKDSFDFQPFARLVFSANAYPQVHDISDGFFDRWLIVRFENSFRGQVGQIPKAQLDAQLAAPDELSGALNKAIAALPHIRSSQRIQRTPSMEEAWQEFRRSTDWLLLWLERQLEPAPSEWVEKAKIHLAVSAEAKRLNQSAPSSKALYKRIQQHWPTVTQKQIRPGKGKNGVEAFEGLRWRRGFPPL